MTPEVISRYLRSADDGDFAALAACFTPNGYVIDEGVKRQGHDGIIAWREEIAAKWTFRTTVLRGEPHGDRNFLVMTRIEGDFPGGAADLTYNFELDGNSIAALSIVE
jgi:hypothetical protein